jgi:hypothetical protein
VLDCMSRAVEGDRRSRRLGAGGEAQEQGRRAAWPGERAGDTAAAVRASSCCASPNSSPRHMGLASTTLSAEAAEAASRKLEPSLAVGFN